MEKIDTNLCVTQIKIKYFLPCKVGSSIKFIRMEWFFRLKALDMSIALQLLISSVVLGVVTDLNLDENHVGVLPLVS